MASKDLIKKQAWEIKINQWLDGGLNASTWCRENSENFNKLHYWRNEIYPGYKKTIEETVSPEFPNRSLYIYDRLTDMRKGFESLVGVVIEDHESKLKSGVLFGFINNRFNRIKVLYWNDNGLVIWYKRLERGTMAVDKSLFLLEKEGEFLPII